ncbi:MAG: PAS domain S-box protein [Desulfobacteraceae bacterium]|nr:PAS domain S-box protein [Desulfobacteraceae bacterium]
MIMKPTYPKAEERVKKIGQDILFEKCVEEQSPVGLFPFKDIVQYLPDPTFVIDKNKKIVAWNRALEEMTGIPKERMIGQGNNAYSVPFWGTCRQILIDLIMDQDPDILKNYDHVEAENGSFTAEVFLPNFRGGKYLWLKASPLFDSVGNMVGAIEALRDITKLKEAEAALLESEKKYKYLFNSAPVGMCEIDFIKGKFINVNKVMCVYSGYSQEEFFSMHCLDILSDNSKKRFMEGFEQLLVGKKMPANLEYTVLKKNGQKLSVILTYDYIYKNGKLIGATLVAHDITKRKKMEEIMIQNEKMLSVGGLAAGMAHEINNPLAGMIQNANVLINRLTNSELPANQQVARQIGIDMESIKTYMEKRQIPAMIKAINETGRRMAAIIANMLSFARKSDDRRSSHFLSELMDKTLELAITDFDLKKHYDFKTIRILKEYEDNIPPVPCDAAKIQQVLLNILRNGAQAMQTAGIIEPEFIIRIGEEENQNMVYMEIKDNGPGMDNNVLKRVFDPFYTTKPVGVGTGLGLSVSYFIITENHGGEISVTSTPGFGANFIICLPLEGK